MCAPMHVHKRAKLRQFQIKEISDMPNPEQKK